MLRLSAVRDVSQRPSENAKLQVYAIAGFSDASPDWGVGLNFSYGY